MELEAFDRGEVQEVTPFWEFSTFSLLSSLLSAVTSFLDVAVDIRSTSPTFLQWHGEILSAANRKSLLIPEGYAHGFQALTEDCELIYLHTSAYHPDAEGALNVTDPALSIDWPLPVIDLSKRDQNHPFVTNVNFKGITL